MMAKVLVVFSALFALSCASIDADYEAYFYNVSTESGKVCLSVQLSACFTVKYRTSSVNGSNGTATTQVVLPNSTAVNVSGTCLPNSTGGHRIELKVEFSRDGESDQKKEKLVFGMGFNVTNDKPDKVKEWSVTEVSLMYPLTAFPKAKFQETVTVFNTDPGISSSSGLPYKCAAEKSLNLEDNKNHTVQMTYKDILLNPANENRAAQDCKADKKKKKKTDKVVPIAVGCALAGLLLIVIIAWLVGRNSKLRTGYKEV